VPIKINLSAIFFFFLNNQAAVVHLSLSGEINPQRVYFVGKVVPDSFLLFYHCDIFLLFMLDVFVDNFVGLLACRLHSTIFRITIDNLSQSILIGYGILLFIWQSFDKYQF